MAKTNLTIKMKVSELVYDIQNRTDLTGQARYNGQNDEFVAKLRMNDDDENANQALRSITTAYGRLKTKLSEYISVNDSYRDATGDKYAFDEMVYDEPVTGKLYIGDLNEDRVKDSADLAKAIQLGLPHIGDLTGDGTIGEDDAKARRDGEVTKLNNLGSVGGGTVSAATLSSEDYLYMYLTLPSNYNHAADDDVAQAVHNYIVNYAIFDWFRIVDKEDAKDYLDLSEANLLQIREAINKRIRPTRVTG